MVPSSVRWAVGLHWPNPGLTAQSRTRRQRCAVATAPEHDESKPVRRQGFDVPLIPARVDEYRLYSGGCAACGKSHRAALSAWVTRTPTGVRAGHALRLDEAKDPRPACATAGLPGAGVTRCWLIFCFLAG